MCRLVVNFIDNNILVPLIYSKSVKSHPLEIFFVIIMGGSLAGLLGMLLAVPVYTVLRVIAKGVPSEIQGSAEAYGNHGLMKASGSSCQN